MRRTGQGGPADARINNDGSEYLDASDLNGAGLQHQLRAQRLTKRAPRKNHIVGKDPTGAQTSPELGRIPRA